MQDCLVFHFEYGLQYPGKTVERSSVCADVPYLQHSILCVCVCAYAVKVKVLAAWAEYVLKMYFADANCCLFFWMVGREKGCDEDLMGYTFLSIYLYI